VSDRPDAAGDNQEIETVAEGGLSRASDVALSPGGADPAALELASWHLLDTDEPEVLIPDPDLLDDPSALLGVDHIAVNAHSYPGEEIVFRTRVNVRAEVVGYSLEVTLPEGLEVTATSQPADASVPRTLVGESDRRLRWDVVGPFAAGVHWIHELRVQVLRYGDFDFEALGAFRGAPLVSTASAWPFDENGDIAGAMVSETMVVEVRPKAAYLRHLPALYERDPLMGRFLMLFESFWGPIDMQVSNISDYFDPMLMPLQMVRWMGERLDLEILPDWPESTQRRMLANAVGLYRKRGTRAGLQRLLEIYSGGQVVINEHRADNFRLGKSARLGQGIALGSGNQPFSFAVRITLPPIDGAALPPAEIERQRDVRIRRLRALIDAEKPAHVTYTLDVLEAAPDSGA
jgi:phage tail-like protein